MHIIETVSYSDLELRSDGSTLSGLVIPFNKPGRVKKGMRVLQEQFLPDSVSWQEGVKLSRLHNPLEVIASYPHSMQLEARADGIHWSAQPAENGLSLEVREQVKAETLRGCSAEFYAIADHFEGQQRTISKAVLVGISLVPNPAYPSTHLEARQSKRRFIL